MPGEPPEPAATTVARGAEGLTLDSGVFAVRLPAEGETKFAAPRRIGGDHDAMVRAYGGQEQAGLVPGPLQGFRLHGGEWVGGSYFGGGTPEQALAVVGYTCRITGHGPLFTEATVAYRFEGERFYRFTVRLAPGSAQAWIDEQFDLGEVGVTRDWRQLAPRDPTVVFSLSGGARPGGWRPDHVFWERQPYGSGVQPQKTALEQELAKRPGFDFSNAAFGTHALPYDAGHAGAVIGIEPWAVFGNYVYVAGLVQAAQVASTEAPPFVGIVPVHAGNWRADGPYSLKWLTTHASGDVAWHLPLTAQAHPNRSTHTGEFDPGQPYTLGRRQWVLVGGPMQSLKALHDLRGYEGYISLDDYKDWILEWPGGTAADYPRLFFDRAFIDGIQPALAGDGGLPSTAGMRQWLYVEDKAERAAALYTRLAANRGYWGSALGQINADLDYWFPLWRQGHAASQWAPEMEELLSSRHLTDEQRRTLRAQLAAMACLASEPDYGPRGSMVHLGNPNMAIVRFMPLLYAAALLPDHPRAAEWLDVMSQFVDYKLASNTGPDGGWSELFSYYDASAPTLLHAANILDRMGRLSPASRRLALDLAVLPLRFQSPEDPRFGFRAVPCWGHEGRANFGQWLPAFRLAEGSDATLAAGLLWGWHQSASFAGYHDSNFNVRCAAYAAGKPAPALPEVAALLDSRWIPGLGVAMRAHAGDPNETFLAYRQGYLISHCDDNQGDFVLFSKGAPLVDMSLFAYPLHQHEPYIQLNAEFGWYSYPRLSPQNVASDMRQGSNNRNLIGAWNASSAVHAHAFAESVDYLRGRADYPPRRWSRQILFLKGQTATGPNYVVFRDSFDILEGAAGELTPYWWNLRTVGATDRVTPAAAGLEYRSPHGPRLLVQFPGFDKIQAETRQAARQGSTFAHLDKWPTPGQATMDGKTDETLSVTAVGPIAAGRDTLAVLYPAAEGEAPPRTETPAEGVLRIETSEGVDWVFAGRRPLAFDGGDVAFRGLAGAVRIRPHEVHLVVCEGPGEARYRGVTLRSAVPASRVLSTDEARAERLIAVEAPAHGIRFEPPAGTPKELAPGVRHIEMPDGFALVFEDAEPLTFEQDGAFFHGRRGAIVVNRAEGTVRIVVLDGEGAGAGGSAVWNGVGPYDFTFHRDRIVGRHAGGGREVNLTVPPGLDKYATAVVDGVPCLAGTSVTTDPAVAGRAGAADRVAEPVLVVPLLSGEHQVEVRNLDQPPVFRNWQAW
ncbi:MAG: hypothetical protein BWZ02_00609 [Lentisphaerae bacterium ADurb.BinA184]|nr:MAG: hypothetical protein BWZ02_00609 [Lentisphaerae bacterium ADurb.BinA184]